jgi:hypothetical protein
MLLRKRLSEETTAIIRKPKAYAAEVECSGDSDINGGDCNDNDDNRGMTLLLGFVEGS